jgi:hypothetical protein
MVVAETAEEVEDLPNLDVDISVERVGAALRLDVSATGRVDHPRAPFENPELWRIEARQANRGLKRLVNGGVRIERSPFGFRQWDTNVRFTVVYQVSGAGKVHVRLTPPEARSVDRVIEI